MMNSLFKKIVFYLYSVILKPIPQKYYKHIISMFEKFILATRKISLGHTIIVDQQIQNVKFKIRVRKNNLQAHYTYTDLLKDKDVVYKPSTIVCLNSILKIQKKPIFADVGAFVGHYACYVSKLLNYDTPVYALEANSSFCEDIRRNASLNNISNIEVINSILSDKKEESFVYDVAVMNPQELEQKKLISNDYYNEVLKSGRKIFTTTIDDVFKEKEIMPNIVKLDAHGAEGKILSGSKNLLKNNVNYILMEVHTPKDLEMYSPGYTNVDIVKGLIDLDFNCYLISPHSDGHRKLFDVDWTNAQSYLNNTSKLKYFKIEKDLATSVLYDRNFSDIFILAIKKDLDIRNLDCF